MKRVAVLVAVLFLAGLLAGCAGGGSTGTTTATPSGGTTATPAAAAGATGGEPETKLPRPFDKKPTTPEFFIEALNKNQPILVLFYGEDEISRDILGEIKKLYEDKYYGGGSVFMLMKLDDNPQTKKLAREFKIGYVPYTAILNRSSAIIYEKNGYIDRKLIEQALYDAMNKL